MSLRRTYPNFPLEGFFYLKPHPSENSSLDSDVPVKLILALKTLPLPIEFAMTLHWVGMDIFWNHTFSDKCSQFP